MFFELNRRVIFFLYKDFEKNHEFFYGGDVNENRHFIEGKWVAHYQKKVRKMLIRNFEKIHEIFYGGDVNQNRNFIEGKWVAHYQKNKLWEKCLSK